MADLKDKFKNIKDKISGETKEAVGKLTDDEELELKGKIQSTKADAVKKINDKKDEILEKVNEKIEDMDDKKQVYVFEIMTKVYGEGLEIVPFLFALDKIGIVHGFNRIFQNDFGDNHQPTMVIAD